MNHWLSCFLPCKQQLSMKKIHVGNTIFVISYQLRDIYSIHRFCWNVNIVTLLYIDITHRPMILITNVLHCFLITRISYSTNGLLWNAYNTFASNNVLGETFSKEESILTIKLEPPIKVRIINDVYTF